MGDSPPFGARLGSNSGYPPAHLEARLHRCALLPLLLSGCQPLPPEKDAAADTGVPDTDGDTGDTSGDTDTGAGVAPDVGAFAVGLGGRACRVEPTGTLACVGPAPVGDGTDDEAAAPSRAVGLTDVVGAAVMNVHGCAVRADGQVACWGVNVYDVLGTAIGAGEIAYVPVDVPGVTDAVQVAAGLYHTCVRHAGGTVSCWGNGDTLAAGDPAGAEPGALLRAEGITSAVDLSADLETSCVALADGTARCWGSNSAGQLGDGTTLGSGFPVPVDGVEDAVRVAVGRQHACALLADGGVACWGDDGSNLWSPGATGRVPGVEDAVAIDAGEDLTCALRVGGTVACWGALWEGVDEVVGLADVAVLAVGGAEVCAIRRDGEAWCVDDGGLAIVPHAPEVAEPAYTCVGDRCEAAAWPASPALPVVRGEVVADRLTGLVWQRRAPDGRQTAAEAAAYCDMLVLDGRSDWRLPTRAELLSIHDVDRDGDALDATIFPYGVDNGGPDTGAWFWTRTVVGEPEGWQFSVGARAGLPTVTYPDAPGAVRCVRAPDYRDLADRWDVRDGSVVDRLTGLAWEREPPTTLTDHATAEARCAGLSLDGAAGWRLPHVRELQSLVDNRWSAPALDPGAGFATDASEWFWSDSTWGVHFADGDTVSYDVVALDKRGRCVR